MATTEKTHTQSGSTQTTFDFTFPYLKLADIKVSVNGVAKTYGSASSGDWYMHNATNIKLNTAPSNGDLIRIYRETDDSSLKASFFPGSAIRAGDLNDNFTQNLYTTQESSNDSTSALNNSRESNNDGTYTSAITKASTAVTTANSATTTAGNAVTTANAADSAATSAVTTANNANTTAGNANTTAGNAVTTANGAVTTANAATVTANGAVTTANAATATANTADANATTAVNTANGAVTTANAADAIADEAKLATDRLVATTANNGTTWTLTGNNTNASTDPKGVGYAVTTAEAASATANAAQSAVANSVLYTPVAAVANIPGSPSDNDYVEVTNSTGIESFSPLAGLPSGFTGDAGLTVKLRYTTSGSTWNYQAYHASDSEDRYLPTYGKHNTTQVNYTVKVVTKTAAHRYHGTGSSNGYTIGGIESPFLTLIPGNTYRFDTSDSSNSGHILKFYRNADRTGAWTDNVTTNGTSGQTNAYTQIVITDLTPGSLSYQCGTQSHSYMGNGMTTNTGEGGAGATGGGSDQIFSENDQTMTTDYSITANKNASAVGPIAIASGITLIIPSTSKLLVLN